jgi:prefoldin subunit 5
MSYAVCRVQKIKGASAVAGLEIHNKRERDKSHSNPDIDRSRSDDNYSLIDRQQGKSYNVLADERIVQGYTGKKAIRKDAVKVCEVLFTSDNDFFQGKSPYEQRQYFQDCHDWACKRFGESNIIASTVHMDETTPHLHVDFVPLTNDGRLSAKSVLGGRVDLQLMQDDFFVKVGKPWGLERGERADLDDPNAPKPRKHQETTDFKRSKVKELEMSIQSLEREKTTIENELEDFRNKSKDVKTGKDIMLDERRKIEDLAIELDEYLKSPVKMPFHKKDIESIFKTMKRILLKAHNRQEKASSTAFTVIEERDKAINANKSLAKVVNQVPILEKTIESLKKKIGELTRKVKDYEDFHEKAGLFLEEKGLKSECNEFVCALREQEKLAIELEKELQRQSDSHFDKPNRGFSR